jgi:hypothetical protein
MLMSVPVLRNLDILVARDAAITIIEDAGRFLNEAAVRHACQFPPSER